MRTSNVGLLLILALGVCAAAPAGGPSPAERAATAVRADAIRAHVSFLADDLLEGRGTGTRGYALAARYVATQFEGLGLSPAGDSGGFYQSVPFLSVTPIPSECSISLTRGGRAKFLAIPDDALVGAAWARDHDAVDAPLVFAGYGVTAPELGWDDYAGLDVRGKVVVMLRGAPKQFEHNQRAFYSWSANKERFAAEHGAIGIATFRTPDDENRAPWPRVVRQAQLPAMRWTDATGRVHDLHEELRLDLRLSPSGAAAVFDGASITLAHVFALVDSGRMSRFALPATVRARLAMRTQRVASPNVVARLAGSDPKLAREVVVISAHLDHLGIGVPVNGDSIHNGAFDNASGIACMLETARAIVSTHARPRRSLLFLAVTGEEKGLQGSDYFAERPTVADSIVADVNLDMFLMTHPFRQVTAFGEEHSSLGPAVERAARATGVRVVPDAHPDEVVFVRSDQFSFVRRGVPSVFPVNGGGTAAEDSIDANWERTRYHSPSDDLAQPIDWESGAGFTRFAVRLTLDVADAAAPPAWNQGDYFGKRFAKK